MLNELLRERDLLPILKTDAGADVVRETWPARREELRRALETWSYGVTPPPPARVEGQITEANDIAYAGKVLENRKQAKPARKNKQQAKRSGKNSFTNFQQRDYDYDKLEQILTGS